MHIHRVIAQEKFTLQWKVKAIQAKQAWGQERMPFGKEVGKFSTRTQQLVWEFLNTERNKKLLSNI